ncbi:MAG: tRNA uridine-5-carboxymethylaminomethyl(34) synthesis GTPase MnmE [Verrucomicrobiae bacterium]|nr:tRNA uridine-5-carboxymethylaminomethyl(34) synthesis GTPase MnmE [Verrucomicrobiae bacterium]
MDDTIAAISTPMGVGGIAIIRISGPQAFSIADAVFHSPRGKPSDFPTHTLHFGRICRGTEVLDEVVLAVFRAPHSYTREDIVEIHCHGGRLTAQSILALCLEKGARLAEPGEFTKRAFLNGRIDLAQAEAVLDVISAQAERARQAGIRALQGALSRKIHAIEDSLTTTLTHLEAWLEFPEDDVPPPDPVLVRATLNEATEALDKLASTALKGRILREGFRVVITGRPNVGKSSLMNALLERDRCIVTPVPGTTRDFVEETLAIEGIPIRLVDTAGYRKPRSTIEAEGIRRTLELLRQADLVLHVLDLSRSFSKLDLTLAEACNHKPVIRVLNKADLPRRLRIPSHFPQATCLITSATTRQGLDALLENILKHCTSLDSLEDLDITVNTRQSQAIERALSVLQGVQSQHAPPEAIASAIRSAISALGEITGATVTDEILNRIFSTFCIGK